MVLYKSRDACGQDFRRDRAYPDAPRERACSKESPDASILIGFSAPIIRRHVYIRLPDKRKRTGRKQDLRIVPAARLSCNGVPSACPWSGIGASHPEGTVYFLHCL